MEQNSGKNSLQEHNLPSKFATEPIHHHSINNSALPEVHFNSNKVDDHPGSRDLNYKIPDETNNRPDNEHEKCDEFRSNDSIDSNGKKESYSKTKRHSSPKSQMLRRQHLVSDRPPSISITNDDINETHEYHNCGIMKSASADINCLPKNESMVDNHMLLGPHLDQRALSLEPDLPKCDVSNSLDETGSQEKKGAAYFKQPVVDSKRLDVQGNWVTRSKSVDPISKDTTGNMTNHTNHTTQKTTNAEPKGKVSFKHLKKSYNKIKIIDYLRKTKSTDSKTRQGSKEETEPKSRRRSVSSNVAKENQYLENYPKKPFGLALIIAPKLTQLSLPIICPIFSVDGSLLCEALVYGPEKGQYLMNEVIKSRKVGSQTCFYGLKFIETTLDDDDVDWPWILMEDKIFEQITRLAKQARHRAKDYYKISPPEHPTYGSTRRLNFILRFRYYPPRIDYVCGVKYIRDYLWLQLLRDLKLGKLKSSASNMAKLLSLLFEYCYGPFSADTEIMKQVQLLDFFPGQAYVEEEAKRLWYNGPTGSDLDNIKNTFVRLCIDYIQTYGCDLYCLNHYQTKQPVTFGFNHQGIINIQDRTVVLVIRWSCFNSVDIEGDRLVIDYYRDKGDKKSNAFTGFECPIPDHNRLLAKRIKEHDHFYKIDIRFYRAHAPLIPYDGATSSEQSLSDHARRGHSASPMAVNDQTNDSIMVSNDRSTNLQQVQSSNPNDLSNEEIPTNDKPDELFHNQIPLETSSPDNGNFITNDISRPDSTHSTLIHNEFSKDANRANSDTYQYISNLLNGIRKNNHHQDSKTYYVDSAARKTRSFVDDDPPDRQIFSGELVVLLERLLMHMNSRTAQTGSGLERWMTIFESLCRCCLTIFVMNLIWNNTPSP